MNQTRLRITGPSGVQEIPLDDLEITLGRSDDCDIVLDQSNVSRRHAKVSRDPFGRWIVENLGSRNGVTIAGKQISVQAIFPHETFHIRPFAFELIEDLDERPGLDKTLLVVDTEVDTDIVPYRWIDKEFSPAMVVNLNEFTTALLKLTNPAQLYGQACQSLAAMLNVLVAVVRLPTGTQPTPHTPKIVACHFGKTENGSVLQAECVVPLSQRVLEAAKVTDTPVKATGVSSDQASKANIGLTIVDEHAPHVVFAVRMSETNRAVDVLYLDAEQSQVPQGMFDFVEAIARQINFAQKNLLLAEVQQQQQDLHQANKELQEKDRIKDEYVARVTHDIKGHLAAIQSCLYLVSRGKQSLDEIQCEFLTRAKKRTVQVTDFVKGLLELTRMRLSCKFEVAPFSLPEAIERSLAAVAAAAQDKSIALTSCIDKEIDLIIGNAFSITEMVSNLLFNAIKYTPENKTVCLQADKRGDRIYIDISDTGIGIPTEDLGWVFDEFFRASNAKGFEKDGSGLGLAIVRQIVDRHAGNISVVSQLGQGTTFTVILPISGPEGEHRV